MPPKHDHSAELERVGLAAHAAYADASLGDETYLGVIALPCGCFDLQTDGLDGPDLLRLLVNVIEQVVKQMGGTVEVNVNRTIRRNPGSATGAAG